MDTKKIGKYELREKRGEGGFGVLYKAFDTVIEREIALKLLHQQFADDEKFSAWFHREAKAMAKLNHPNIVTIYNFEIVNNNHFIVMEYIDGKNIDEIMREKGAFDLENFILIARQLLSALGYAHSSGIIHRDIKPSNIMVTDTGLVKITDFGIAKILGSSKLTQTGTAAGSLPYMSPEQIRGKAIDARTDIYSLGITFFQMLTGDVPFKEDSDFLLMQAHLEKLPPRPTTRRADIPVDLEEILLKSLEKKVEQRYASTADMAQAVVKFQRDANLEVDSEQILAAEVLDRTAVDEPDKTRLDAERTEFKPPPPTKKGPRPIIPMLAAIVAVVVAIVVWQILKSGENKPPPLPIPASDTGLIVVADFSYEPEGGNAPLKIQFKDLSKNDPTAWEWDFGDGQRSTRQNPSHNYKSPGEYYPKLIVANQRGSDTLTNLKAVVITSPPPPEEYTGKLEIYYTPYDISDAADLYLNGQKIPHGDMPIYLDNLKPGRYEILLVRRSHDWEHSRFFDTITVTENRQSREYSFVGLEGKVRVSASIIGGTPGWGEIYIDDKKRDVGTPYAFDLMEGPHKIAVIRDGYETVGGYKIVNLEGGDDIELNFKLRKK
jgi:serine/threonine protein kinase